MPDALCLVRGGGDLATGVAWRLFQAGYPVVVAELPQPLTVRRLVALSTAVTEGRVSIEGMEGRLAADPDQAVRLAFVGLVGVVVSPELPPIGADVVIDARLAKRNIDTTIADARLVVGLGPGFTAGIDCHAVIETNRGHRLGRCLWHGSAEADTGTPGLVAGRGAERVIRAPGAGPIDWFAAIGDQVAAGDRLGAVAGAEVLAPLGGVVRGLIRAGTPVERGLKIADIDPRIDTPVDEISDKALAVGGGVLEAVLRWERSGP